MALNIFGTTANRARCHWPAGCRNSVYNCKSVFTPSGLIVRYYCDLCAYDTDLRAVEPGRNIHETYQ
eukprot:5957047-Pleurochrysis_carterae.AAC.1